MPQLKTAGIDNDFIARLNDCAVFLTQDERDRILTCLSACAGLTNDFLEDYQDGSLKSWIDEADDSLSRVDAALESVDYSGMYYKGIEKLKAALEPFANPLLYAEALDADTVIFDTGHATLTARDFMRARVFGG